MKIISKYKDYYDYLQGIWGMDEKLVLDRTKSTETPLFVNSLNDYITMIRFYICGKVVEGVYYQEKSNIEGSFLYGNEIEDVLGDRLYKSDSRRWSLKNDPKYYYILYEKGKWWSQSIQVLKEPTQFFELDHEPTGYYRERKKIDCPNNLLNCPIVIEHNPIEGIYDISKCEQFPVLKDYNFHKVYSAQDMWLMVGEWIGREKIIPNNQTNSEKVLSNGFDLKTSFRHPVK